LLGTIIGLILIGVVGGFVARAIVRGASAMDTSEKILVSVAGSLAGGLVGHIVLHHGRGISQPSSWIGSIIGSVIVLSIYLHVQQRRRATSDA
jgi:uncharacterized membrane protein YeaQ/YmgE (transglycosylase-associated protein family)